MGPPGSETKFLDDFWGKGVRPDKAFPVFARPFFLFAPLLATAFPPLLSAPSHLFLPLEKCSVL